MITLGVSGGAQPAMPSVSGSPLWQVVFISFAVILILFETVRGWRLGLMRQIARLVALGAAYPAGFLGGGSLLVPVARPFFKMPDAMLSLLCGAALALVTYAVVSGVGAILFKRTSHHESGAVRIIYGSTGAIIGLFFGAFLLWLVIAGVRTVGALAQGQTHSQSRAAGYESADPTSRAIEIRRRFLLDSDDSTAALATSLARLKNSLELPPLGKAVKQADPISQKTYETLEKASSVFSSPERTQRFLTFPGARELSEHPKVVALRSDPEIIELIAQKRLFELLQNPRVLEVANDPVLRDRVKKFDIQRALDYALEQK
jgi:hypothetical protein